eukprot:gene481-261_t
MSAATVAVQTIVSDDAFPASEHLLGTFSPYALQLHRAYWRSCGVQLRELLQHRATAAQREATEMGIPVLVMLEHMHGCQTATSGYCSPPLPPAPNSSAPSLPPAGTPAQGSFSGVVPSTGSSAPLSEALWFLSAELVNHEYYWRSIVSQDAYRPRGSQGPLPRHRSVLGQHITRDFGGLQALHDAFIDLVCRLQQQQPGGWVWLVWRKRGVGPLPLQVLLPLIEVKGKARRESPYPRLELMATGGAFNPLCLRPPAPASVEAPGSARGAVSPPKGSFPGAAVLSRLRRRWQGQGNAPTVAAGVACTPTRHTSTFTEMVRHSCGTGPGRNWRALCLAQQYAECCPLFACDAWEHARLPDYGLDIVAYAESFWRVLNWDFVARQLEQCPPPVVPLEHAIKSFYLFICLLVSAPVGAGFPVELKLAKKINITGHFPPYHTFSFLMFSFSLVLRGLYPSSLLPPRFPPFPLCLFEENRFLSILDVGAKHHSIKFDLLTCAITRFCGVLRVSLIFFSRS